MKAGWYPARGALEQKAVVRLLAGKKLSMGFHSRLQPGQGVHRWRIDTNDDYVEITFVPGTGWYSGRRRIPGT